MLVFKDINIAVNIKNIHNIEKKKNSIGISVFGYENKEKYPMKKSMFLPKFSIDSFMMIHYTAEENITEEKLKRLL